MICDICNGNKGFCSCITTFQAGDKVRLKENEIDSHIIWLHGYSPGHVFTIKNILVGSVEPLILADCPQSRNTPSEECLGHRTSMFEKVAQK
jgi:hypothetical protein